MSASLNSLAGIIYEDYIRKYKLINHTEQKGNLTMKALTAILGIYCILMGAVVSKFGHILQVNSFAWCLLMFEAIIYFYFQIVFTISGIVGGAMMGAFLLGMLWPWANKTGALYGTVSSIVILIWIVVSGQIAIGTGELKYQTLPTKTDGCHRHGFNFTEFIMYVNFFVHSSK
jgi:Na+/proline symporter